MLDPHAVVRDRVLGQAMLYRIEREIDATIPDAFDHDLQPLCARRARAFRSSNSYNSTGVRVRLPSILRPI